MRPQLPPPQLLSPLLLLEQISQKKIVKVSADEALAILKDQPAAILLDVRTEAEFAEGHIEGAQQLAVEELLDRTDELPADKNTPIVIYCRSGRRSALAAEQLAGLGYTMLYDLGGITSWPYDIVQ
jgi:rhodanese-related sulfurtransferase